ncbi:MAG: HEAT repeat domain-containing protein [Chloroflexi bacterium]|nr:HEAT repeat domain-containing protein [Chloroflexota bacterium]MCC6893408.1 HEAT repeat domain-containing protein [Anaerolineae bacterium]
MDNELRIALENMSSRDYTLRSQALEVINQARERAVPGLLEVLKNGDGYRQEIALAILWGFFRDYGIRHPDLVITLLEAIDVNRDNNPLVVQDGIGFIADLKDPTAFDALVEFLSDEDKTLREAAVEGLGLLADPRAIPFLILALNDLEKIIQARATWALGQIAEQNPSEVDMIIPELRRGGTPDALKLIKKLQSHNK